MSWKWREKPNQFGANVAEWNTPIIGVDTFSGETRLSDGHIAFTQNMDLSFGRPEGRNGYSLLDTAMDADDDQPPQGFGQYVTGSTETYVIVQQSGRTATWDAAGNTWTQRHTGMTSDAGIDTSWNEINYATYLIWANPTDGNWKWDGSNWLPLGARNITDCESDQDGQWANETAETTVVREGAQSYSRAVASGATQALTFTPTTNLNLSTPLLLGATYTEANAGIGFFLRVSDASEVTTATSFFEIATLSGTHELQIQFNSASFRVFDPAGVTAGGSAVTLADNTWFHVFIRLSDMTETGTFNLADIDTLAVSITAPVGPGLTYYVDGFYIAYNSRMPGVETMAVWNDVLFGAGATASGQDPSDVHFAPVGAPDEYDATAFLSINPDAGGPIRSLKRFFNQVFVGKENSVHSIGGTTAGTTYPNFNYEVLDITAEHGCDGHRSVVEMEKKLHFPWKKRYYTYDGTGTLDIGERITPDLADHSATRLRQKISALYDGEIWTAYPGVGDTNNTRLYKYTTSADRTGFVGVEDDSAALNLNILKTVFETGVEKIVGVDEAGDIMWLDDSAVTTFDGGVITRICRFPWVTLEGNRLMYWDTLLALFGAQSAGTISVRYRIADHPRAFDAASFVAATTQALSSVDTLGWVLIGEVSRWIQIEFLTTAAQFDLQFPVVLEAYPVGYQV